MREEQGCDAQGVGHHAAADCVRGAECCSGRVPLVLQCATLYL